MLNVKYCDEKIKSIDERIQQLRKPYTSTTEEYIEHQKRLKTAYQNEWLRVIKIKLIK